MNNIVNDASGNVAVGGTLTVGGVAAVAVAPGTSGNVLTSNGTAWTSAAPSGGTAPSAIGQIPFSTNGSTYTPTQKITQATAVASTSGTSIDFTGIPSWVKRVTVMFNGVSTNGTSIKQVQIGSGSIVTTGYSGGYGGGGAAAWNGGTLSSGVALGLTGSASDTNSGIMSIANMGSNLWVLAFCGGSSAANYAGIAGGSIQLAGTLDRVRITTVNGTDTFDAGSINIMYE